PVAPLALGATRAAAVSGVPPSLSRSPSPSPSPSPLPSATVGTTSGATVFAQDTFAGRSVANGWGTASDGNVWQVQAGNTGVLSVAGNEGRVDGSNSMALLVATL